MNPGPKSYVISERDSNPNLQAGWQSTVPRKGGADWHPPRSEIAIHLGLPRRPLLLLAVAMVFTTPPMFGNLVPWVPISFLGALCLRFWMDWRGTRLRSMIIKLGLIAGGFLGVALSYQALSGPEPGLSICLILIGVKILEAHTAREFHVLAALGAFSCLAMVMISQSLGTAIASGIALTLVIAAVLQFHRSSGGPFLAPLRDAGLLILQATPLVIVLFFLFPRGNGGLGFLMRGSFSSSTGMSDNLSPGSVASLAMSDDVAFRVEFPDGNMPPVSAMYWRGGVFAEGEEMNWTTSKIELGSSEPESMEGTPVRQRIVLLPHGDRWMFALDKPVKAPKGVSTGWGNVLVSNERVGSTRQYEVSSLPKNIPRPLSPREQKVCLKLTRITPRVRDLVQKWAEDDPEMIVSKALEFFRNGGFRYSLSPGEYGDNALDEFLFRRRTGFCEHYAAAFATLMRVADIPSRVVIGYQGGEYNSRGGYLIVRQSYAHAWCEVWLPRSGWQRVDPTAVVTPERVTAGFDSLQASRANSGREGLVSRSFRKRGWLHDLQLAWDSLNYRWETNVVGFDASAQQWVLVQLGFLNSRPAMLFGLLLLTGVFLLSIHSFAAWWKARPRRDPLVLLYARFCKRTNALGARREPWEGPTTFAGRACQLLPDHAERINRITSLYVLLRYSSKPDQADKSHLAQEIKAFCKR